MPEVLCIVLVWIASSYMNVHHIYNTSALYKESGQSESAGPRLANAGRCRGRVARLNRGVRLQLR